MKRIERLALFVFLMLGTVCAQQAPPNDQPATKEDIEHLFTTLHVRDQMRGMMEMSAKQSIQMAQESLKKRMPEISQKDLERINSMVDRVLEGFDVNGMLDDMIPVYQHHLTKADVAAMAAFYETPTGQKLLREQPQMTAEAMKAVQPRMEKMMSSILDEAEKMAKDTATESKPTNTNKN